MVPRGSGAVMRLTPHGPTACWYGAHPVFGPKALDLSVACFRMWRLSVRFTFPNSGLLGATACLSGSLDSISRLFHLGTPHPPA